MLGVGSVDLLMQNKLGRQKEVIGTFTKVITFGRIKHHKQNGKSNYKIEETMWNWKLLSSIKSTYKFILSFLPLHFYLLPAEIGMEHRAWYRLDRCSTTELTVSLQIKSIFENIICKSWDICFVGMFYKKITKNINMHVYVTYIELKCIHLLPLLSPL